MKKIYSIILIGFFTITISAQEKIAKIEFETTVIDYGTIEKGANPKNKVDTQKGY